MSIRNNSKAVEGSDVNRKWVGVSVLNYLINRLFFSFAYPEPELVVTVINMLSFCPQLQSV